MKPREFWIGETEAMWHVAESYLETQDWEFEVIKVREVMLDDPSKVTIDYYFKKIDRLTQALEKAKCFIQEGVTTLSASDKAIARIEAIERGEK